MLEYTLLYNEKPFLLKHNENKVVIWSKCVGLNGNTFSLDNSTRLSIPNHAKMARFSFSFVFPPNPNGYRQVFSRLNGENYPIGYLTSSQYGGFENGSSNSFSAIGPWITVSKNDYWELIVVQDSGSDMLILPKTSSWFQAEWLS